MATLQGKAEASCGKGCWVLGLPLLWQWGGKGWRELRRSVPRLTGVSDAGCVPCSFSQVEKPRAAGWQLGRGAPDKSSFLGVSCAWLARV